MAHGSQSTAQIQLRLDRLRSGDESARDELLNIACERLRRLTRKMLRDYRRVSRWEQTDDVLQNAVLRLCRGLDGVKPATVRSFINLAAVQIRRELIDLARHYNGPEGPGRHHASRAGSGGSGSLPGPPEAANDTDDPARLAALDRIPRAGRGAARPGERGIRSPLVSRPGSGRGRRPVGRYRAGG